jgi:hypothetical protein
MQESVVTENWDSFRNELYDLYPGSSGERKYEYFTLPPLFRPDSSGFRWTSTGLPLESDFSGINPMLADGRTPGNGRGGLIPIRTDFPENFKKARGQSGQN